MRILPLATVAALCALAGVPASAETMSFSISVETLDRDGVCLIALPRDDGMKLEFTVRAEDANLNVAVQNVPSQWVDEGEGQNVPITIKPNKGKTTVVPNGEYVAGFTYRADGWGTKGKDALILLSTLKGGKTYSVDVGGRDAGSFDIQQSSGPVKNYAYTWMKDCMQKNGGPTNF